MVSGDECETRDRGREVVRASDSSSSDRGQPGVGQPDGGKVFAAYSAYESIDLFRCEASHQLGHTGPA